MACWASTHISIHLGNGDGTFQVKAELVSGSAPHSLVVGRFNGDGNDDLAVVNHGGKNLSVLLGNGDGTFQTAVTYPTQTGPHSIRAGDLDGDGDLDLAVVNDASDSVSILLGNGDGTFMATQSYPTGPTGRVPKGVALADINGDGNLDVLAANTGGNGDGVTGKPGGDVLSILLGNGNGTLQAPLSHAAGQTSFSIATGILNADALPDVVTANWDGDGVSVIVNTSDTTPPTVAITTMSFRTATTATATAIPIVIRWTASDDESGLASFVVRRSVDGGAPVTIATLGSSLRALATTVAPSHTTTFTVQAKDVAGNVVAASSSIRPRMFGESTVYSSWTGTWTTARSSTAIGGTTRMTTGVEATATFRFTGREVGFVAPIGPTRGSVKVYVDGTYIGTVSLTSSSNRSRQVALSRVLASTGPHTLKLVANGPSTHPRIDIDAWLGL